MNRALSVCLLAFALSGCTSFRDDLATICDAPQAIDIENTPSGDRLQKMGKYMNENVKSKKGKEFLSNLAYAGRGARNKMLRDAAAKEGLNPCPLADIY